jgi:hypothetical protein
MGQGSTGRSGLVSFFTAENVTCRAVQGHRQPQARRGLAESQILAGQGPLPTLPVGAVSQVLPNLSSQCPV